VQRFGECVTEFNFGQLARFDEFSESFAEFR
jgi:hypothetical protein